MHIGKDNPKNYDHIDVICINIMLEPIYNCNNVQSCLLYFLFNFYTDIVIYFLSIDSFAPIYLSVKKS